MPSYLDLYRQIDAQYRILNRLYSLEYLQYEQLKAHFRGMKAQAESTFGAIATAVLVVIPIIISLLDITWKSFPALVIYILGSAICLAAGWRIREARSSYQEAVGIVEEYSREPFEDWLDYHKTKISMQVERCALLKKVIEEANEQIRATVESPDRNQLEKLEMRRDRAQLAADYCQTVAREVVARSAELYKQGKRTPEDHASVEVWAEPIIDAT